MPLVRIELVEGRTEEQVRTLDTKADWSFGLGRAQFLTGEL